MISHVVLFRPRVDLKADDRAALVEAFERALRDIPAIRGVRVGRRVMFGAAYKEHGRDAFEFLIAIDFDDLAGLQSYLQHAAHADLAVRFTDASSAAVVYDFDVAQDTSSVGAFLRAE
jgi:hypothetical protein